MTAEDSLQIHSVLLVQDIRQELTGLQTLVGVFPSRLVVQSIPLALPGLQCRIEFSSNPTAPSRMYTFELVAPSGASIFKGDFEFVVPATGTAIAAIAWTPAVFAEEGTYVINLGPKGERLHQIQSYALSVART